LRDEWSRALGTEHLSQKDSTKGTWREGSFTGDNERCVKALEIGICFCKALLLSNEGHTFFSALEKRRESYLEEFL
jgi:hypothetical protein